MNKLIQFLMVKLAQIPTKTLLLVFFTSFSNGQPTVKLVWVPTITSSDHLMPSGYVVGKELFKKESDGQFIDQKYRLHVGKLNCTSTTTYDLTVLNHQSDFSWEGNLYQRIKLDVENKNHKLFASQNEPKSESILDISIQVIGSQGEAISPCTPFKIKYVDMDYDNDLVLNDVDNCPTVNNPDQADFDRNGIGNLCELDLILHNQLVSMGFGYTCAVQNGSLKCWGNNTFGTLGNGTTEQSKTPSYLFSKNVTSLSAGPTYACAIVKGTLYCWGNAPGGVQQLVPTKIVDAEAESVTVGANHVCAVVKSILQCWGTNFNGQLGTGDRNYRLIPTPVVFEDLANSSLQVSSLSAGSMHTCAVVNNDLYCWGSNYRGQLGIGSVGGNDVLSPRKIIASNSIRANVIKVATSDYHTCAIIQSWDSMDQSLQCWGFNGNGQFGNGTKIDSYSPITIYSSGVKDVAVQDSTCVAVHGGVYCSGSIANVNWAYQSVLVPQQKIKGEVDSVEIGYGSSCAIVDQQLHCWGLNYNNNIRPSNISFFENPELIIDFGFDFLDDDFDLISNVNDNCKIDYNPNQDDLDKDGEGDACD